MYLCQTFCASIKLVYNYSMNKEIKKPVMGRPKLDVTANKQLPRIRVTEDQLTAYKAASKNEGKSLSKWAKDLMDKACK